MNNRPKTFICNIKAIPQNGSRGFSIKNDNDDQDMFIVNRDNQYFAYKNECPHTGASLNWQPDVYLSFDETYIQCSIHGAQFEIESGLCVWGPCANAHLSKVPIEVENEKIYLLNGE